MSHDIRSATDRDRDALVRIWHQGWHDAHGELVPSSILAYRTPADFKLWLADGLDHAFLAESGDEVAGFYMLDGAELSKLYVGREARGSGLAGILLDHAERRLAALGVGTAELHCTAGNRRAQRFSQRHGWRWAETFDDALWCPDADIDVPTVPTHRYTKTVS